MATESRLREVRVKLLNYTPRPDYTVAVAMRQSRFKGSIMSLNLKEDEVEHLVHLAIKLGHFSVFEHISFTFAVEGISRSCSHQFVRHRFFAFTQQSQRFIKESDFPYIVPESIKNKKESYKLYTETMEYLKDVYKKLSDEVAIEDARFILPNATETKLVATANGRELMHFFHERISKYAQWEIRKVAEIMLREVKKVAPATFNEKMKDFYI
ncbi:MAG: FAD-dependent thymidylate synthase [Caldisericaceae bacterium]|nr:FAD-dependent thymidylate synthase [Caldisericaceae bacterium]RLD19691.1 MAG: FAD-dependent thymidylate synthase [Caldisericota bacterium]